MDKIIDTVIHDIFHKVRSLDRGEVLEARNASDLIVRKEHVKSLQRDCAKAESDLQRLNEEIVKSLTGESVFSPEMLKPAIEAQEKKCKELLNSLKMAEMDLNTNESNFDLLADKFDDILGWARIYDDADMPTKKMIVSHLIDRVDVSRGYDIKITLNISVEQFLETIEVCV